MSDAADEILWEGTAKNPFAIWTAPILLLITVGAAASGQFGAALIALVGTLMAAPFTRVRVRITNEHIQVALGPWYWPSESHAIADIEWIELDHVDRMEVRLGVGVKGSNRRLAGRRILLRPGPAFRFQGHIGRRLKVTVDGAAAAVATVEQVMGRPGIRPAES